MAEKTQVDDDPILLKRLLEVGHLLSQVVQKSEPGSNSIESCDSGLWIESEGANEIEDRSGNDEESS